jgi:hypothetical protein
VSDETRVCPWCAETIKAAAIVCRYCGRDLPNPNAETDGLQRVQDEYGAVFDVASNLLDALSEPPQNRVAWLAELCKRIAAGSPLEAAAAKIPLHFGAAAVTVNDGLLRRHHASVRTLAMLHSGIDV